MTQDKKEAMTQEHILAVTDFSFLSPEDYGKGPFSLRLGNTTYEVNTHFDPQGRQSVLKQFQRLLLASTDNLT